MHGPLPHGRIDIQELERALEELVLQGFTDFALNLERVSSIDSNQLGDLVRIVSVIKHKGGDVGFVGLTSRLKELLKRMGLWKGPD